MKHLYKSICLVILLISYRGYSQIDINIGLSGGINNNMVFLVFNNKEQYKKINDLLNIEPYFVYSSGVNFQYNFVKEKNSLVFGFNIENNSIKSNQYIFNNYFLTAPVLLKNYLNKRIGFKYGIQNKILISSPQFPDNTINYSLSILFGLIYRMNSKFEISTNIYSDFMPYYKIKLLPYSTQNYYNYGSTISINYKIFEK